MLPFNGGRERGSPWGDRRRPAICNGFGSRPSIAPLLWQGRSNIARESLLARAEANEVLSGGFQAQRTIGATADNARIVIALPIVLPEAHLAD
jgi:hypothetical protein